MSSQISDADLEALFSPNHYLYFYADDYLTPARTALEVQFLRRVLDLDQEMRLLDLACGHGRHANELAHDVAFVVGVDKNPEFVALAQGQALASRLGNVSYVVQDVRRIAYESDFDRAMIINTTFGLFSDAENLELLKSARRALKSGGLLCFDVLNRDTVLVGFQADQVIEKGGDLMIDRCAFDTRTGRITDRRVYIVDGVQTQAAFSMRTYNFTELVLLLREANFELVDVFSDWHSAPLVSNSKKIVAIARAIAN